MKQASKSLINFAGEGRDFKVEGSIIRTLQSIDERDIGHVELYGGRTVYTLTEILEYEDRWIGHSDDLLARVNGLVTLLNRSDITEGLPLLKCRNFYHIPERRALGLIYEIPRSVDSPNTAPEPITLANFIAKTQKRQDRPILEDIFLVAYKIASSVGTFHQAGWFHKAISASTILFFPVSGNALQNAISKLYIVGFNHSQEDGQDAITVGPPKDRALHDYQHSEYSRSHSTVGFGEEFEYYSVGIVLLELCRWKALRHTTKKLGNRDSSPEELRSQLLDQEIPHLGSYMGGTYMSATKACLDGSLKAESSERSRSLFREKVVQPLEKCLVLCCYKGSNEGLEYLVFVS